ncbi:MAG: TetR/AcrR family transcriptional regulator [Steroidobacteraceae bacterium]
MRTAPRQARRLRSAPLDASPAPQAGTRAERQRTRILDAAERCFIERGFHAATMAHIAETARMSPGLIYRYFSGKNAIVRAIVERHLETDGCRAMQHLNVRGDFCPSMLEAFERWRRRDDPTMNAALILELTAEAARDPEILEVVRSKDRVISGELTEAIQRAARAEGTRLSAAKARGAAILLQCLFEGLAFRVVRSPELNAASLRPLLEKVMAAVMS